MQEPTSPFQSHLFALNNDHLEMHKNLSVCVVFGRKGPVILNTEDQKIEAPIVLIKNDVQHELFFPPGGWYALYLDGVILSPDGLTTTVLDEEKWSALPSELLHGSTLLLESLRASIDQRKHPVSAEIAETVDRLYSDPMHRLSQEFFAKRIRLERTQALRFFKDQTGMTFRNFKLWSALLHAAKLVISGSPIGVASNDAGFSDPAHLARTSKSLFGMTPTLGSQSVTGIKTGQLEKLNPNNQTK